MRKSISIFSGVVGAAAATAAVAITAQKHVIGRVRHGIDLSVEGFGALAFDRSGTVFASDGVDLYYEEVGPVDAPLTVVFIHGFCLNLGSWHFQRKELTKVFGPRIRMVFFDLRSHGRSGSSGADHCSMEQLAEDLAHFLDERVPTGPIVLIGHSMGGMAVLALCDERPELFQPSQGSPRVAAVALMSTSTGKLAAVTFGLPALFAKISGSLMPLMLRGAKRRANFVEHTRRLGTDLAWLLTRRLGFAEKDVDPTTLEYLTNMIASTRVEVIADFYPELMRHDKLAALPMLKRTDVLIMCGDHDLFTPPEHSREMADALPDAELVIVPRAGHVAMMERPEDVSGALTTVISRAVKGKHGKRKRKG